MLGRPDRNHFELACENPSEKSLFQLENSAMACYASGRFTPLLGVLFVKCIFVNSTPALLKINHLYLNP
jgi:hypothetical protein